MTAPRLYYWTCIHGTMTGDDGARIIAAPASRMGISQLVSLPRAARMACQLLWVTASPAPHQGMDGPLALDRLRCCPSTLRYRITSGPVEPWPALRADWPHSVVTALESPHRPMTVPESWHVSRGPLTVVTDPYRSKVPA